MWNSLSVVVGHATHKGRYRLEGGALVLEWAGGRQVEPYGQLKPEFVAASRLKRLVAAQPRAA